MVKTELNGKKEHYGNQRQERENLQKMLKRNILLTWTWNLATAVHLKQRPGTIVTSILWRDTGSGSHPRAAPTGNTAR